MLLYLLLLLCSNVSEKLIGTQTNQRAELVVRECTPALPHVSPPVIGCVCVYQDVCLSMQAARRAIQSAIDQGHSAVEVKTDSSYTIKGAPCTILATVTH